MQPPSLPKQKSNSRARWLVVGLIVALVVFGFVGSRYNIAKTFRVASGAMLPTLRGVQRSDGRATVGDHVVVDTLSYRVHAPQRGDIIVFRTDDIVDLPEKSRGQYWIKRLVGLPGERVSIRPPNLWINGAQVLQPEIFGRIQRQENGYRGYVLPGGSPPARYLGRETDTVQLSQDEYFVLGDNSPASLDSRYWGPVKRKAIVGRVISIYWPLDRMGKVE